MPIIEAITVAAALSALGVGLVVFRRRFTSRISRLNSELVAITEDRRFGDRVTVSGQDDAVANLETTVNRMFEVLDAKDQKLSERENLFRDLAESVQEAIVVHRGEIVYANPRAAALRGVRQADLANKPWLHLVHPDEHERARRIVSQRLSGDEVPPRYEMKMQNRDGSGFWIEGSDVVIDYQGKPAILTAGFDITQRRMMQRALAREKERAEVTLESIGEGVITTDTDGLIDYVNSAAEQLIGRTREQARGKTLDAIVSLVDETDRKPLRDPVALALREGRRVGLGRRALLLAAPAAEEFSIELTVSPIRGSDRELLGTVIVMHDVTELRGLARKMSYQASHDALTGLYNRPEFERRLEDALDTAHGKGSGHVVCYLDLDRFKAVNDTCGHMAGDKMLREVAALIKDKVRDSDSVARLGGDEFGMLLGGCPLDKARQIAEDVCRAVEEYRFVWRDKIFNIGVSIGLVEIGHESGSVVDALSAADSACYVAKQQGRSRVHVYSARDEAMARHRGEIQWLQRLQHAIKEDQFELYAQPIVAVAGRTETGPACEVLLRMRDAEGEIVSPSEFIQSAERYQLMPGIDRWVIRTTFAALSHGALKLPDGRSCTINLSGQTLGDPQFLEFVVETLDATGVNPGQVCFEVKESSVITNVSHASRFIEVLHGMGCTFALDDFGSGLGSFSNLKSLSMDYMKIDGSFIRGIGRDAVNQAMVAAMIKLARTLGIRVIAEEVEDTEALEAIRAMGVDFVQGYCIGRPKPLPAAR